MARWSTSSSRWVFYLSAIIILGVLSRTIETGFMIFDKYLGDALYAAMIYAFLRLWWSGPRVAVAALGIMITIEAFQFTGIPAKLPWIVGRLLGTQFSFWDLLAYAVGIGAISVADARKR